MDVNIVNKLEIVDQTPEFLIENAMNIAETYIENLNFQEPLKMLSQLLTYHKISKFSNDIIICATQLTAAISKKALLNISEPYFTLQVLQNLKLIISVYPSILIPEKLSLFNNLACTFRRIGKLHSAKKYIEKALELLKSHREIKERSSTYLNACAVFSNLNKHKDALEFSAQAVNYAQDAMLNLDEAIDFNEKVGKISVLAISYYNIAVENDYLKRHVEAEEWYMKAIRFLMAHQETQNLKDILQDCVRNYEVLKEKILVYRRPESGKLEVNNSFEKYLPAWKRKEPINRDVNLSFDLSFPLEQKPGSFENMRKDKIDLESKRSSKRWAHDMKSHRNLGNNSPIQKRAKSARNKINYTKSPFQPTEKKNVHSNANNPINHRMMQVSTPLKEMPKSNTCLETKPNSNSTFMLNFETQIPDSQTKLANVPEKSKEALIKELVKKIKPTFYGRRYKQLTKTNTQSSVNVFKAGRRISGQYFLIIISKSSDVYKLSLTKLGNADRVFEFPVSNLQIQKPEELIKQIQIKDNGDPYLNIPNGLVKSTLNPEKSQEQSFSKSTNEGAVNRSQSIKYKINLNPDPLSPQRTLPIKSIQKFMLSNDSLEFVNRSPLDSSRFIFKLILATSIMLNEIQTQLMIYLSPKYLKLQLKSLYETVEKVISIEDAAEILNIKKERLESNTDKLCMLIKKNNGLDFIVKSLSLHSDNSDNSLKTDLDESQEIVNIANKSSIDRKIDNVNYHLEGSKIDGIFTLKATKTCDNSVIYKSYSAEEMIKFFGSVVNVDSILAKITIIDKEILLL